MRNRRPSLAEQMQKVARPEPAPAPEGANQQPGGFHAATRTGKKKITAIVDPAVHAQLRHLSIDLDKTVEALLGEAINGLFERYGKPPIA
jgi:hypothetical protein